MLGHMLSEWWGKECNNNNKCTSCYYCCWCCSCYYCCCCCRAYRTSALWAGTCL